MKTLRKFLWGAALLALATAGPTIAQDIFNVSLANIVKAETAGFTLGADDTDVAILVRHIGSSSEASGLVAVAANGDLTFTAGAQGSETTVDDFECPVSGALGGVIDVSDAACNTIEEVVDTINGTCSTCTKGNWLAVPVDALGSDSSNDSLLTISATSANSINGLALNWDTDTVGFNSTILMAPLEARVFPFYVAGAPDAPKLNANPFNDHRSVLLQANATSTYASGTSTYQVWSVLPKFSALQDYSEVRTQLYAEPAGATTVNKIFGGSNGFAPYGVAGRKGEKLISRLSNSAAMASTAHRAYGLFYRFR